jgi:hypothetical protein
MQIFIPTLGRVDDQKTLANLPPNLRADTVLVVQEHEADDHALIDCAGIIALPPEVKTITPTRMYIRDWCVKQHIGKAIMLDDDLEFYVRKSKNDWHLRVPKETEITALFLWIESLLDDYAHVGVSGREGNNYMTDRITHNCRYMRLLGYRVKDWVDCTYHTEIMEDFDINLQLLLKGLPSVVIYHYAQGQKQTNSPGGCSTWRTHELHERNANLLAGLYPDVVKTRQKKNKTGGEFGTRTEVIIQWKKAFKIGSENARNQGA